jgi:hypothetical protein
MSARDDLLLQQSIAPLLPLNLHSVDGAAIDAC